MDSSIPKWTYEAYDLIQHGQRHFDIGDDFDRRMAFISFDNAIEIAIKAYHSNPLDNNNFEKLANDLYPTKIDFFCEIAGNTLTDLETFKAEVIGFHRIRNEIYHGAKVTVPRWADIEGIRNAALTVFAILFDVNKKELEDSITNSEPISAINGLSPQEAFLRNYTALEFVLKSILAEHERYANHPNLKTEKSVVLLWRIYHSISDLKSHPEYIRPFKNYTRTIRKAQKINNALIENQENELIEALSASEWVEISDDLDDIREFIALNH